MPDKDFEYQFRMQLKSNSQINYRLFEDIIRDALTLYCAKTKQEFSYADMHLSFGHVQTLFGG